MTPMRTTSTIAMTDIGDLAIRRGLPVVESLQFTAGAAVWATLADVRGRLCTELIFLDGPFFSRYTSSSRRPITSNFLDSQP